MGLYPTTSCLECAFFFAPAIIQTVGHWYSPRSRRRDAFYICRSYHFSRYADQTKSGTGSASPGSSFIHPRRLRKVIVAVLSQQ